jgi:hypothetical protein
MPVPKQVIPYKNIAKTRILVALTLVVVFILAPLALLLGLASMVEAGHDCPDPSQAGAVVRLVCWTTTQPDIYQ